MKQQVLLRLWAKGWKTHSTVDTGASVRSLDPNILAGDM